MSNPDEILGSSEIVLFEDPHIRVTRIGRELGGFTVTTSYDAGDNARYWQGPDNEYVVEDDTFVLSAPQPDVLFYQRRGDDPVIIRNGVVVPVVEI